MVAYSFKPRFVLPVELGEKRQTIRQVGKKRHARAGETLQLYTGRRMKPRKIGEATCQDARSITLHFDTVEVEIYDPATGSEWLVTLDELDAFAVLDGFPDWQALEDFWRETHAPLPEKWTGIIIRWGDTFRGGLALNPPAGDPS